MPFLIHYIIDFMFTGPLLSSKVITVHLLLCQRAHPKYVGALPSFAFREEAGMFVFGSLHIILSPLAYRFQISGNCLRSAKKKQESPSIKKGINVPSLRYFQDKQNPSTKGESSSGVVLAYNLRNR